jgi:NAD-dependent deacetylase
MENRVLQTCSSLIKKAKNIVVLTGAGISTESGIPDFRSRTGLYQMAPEYILSLDYFYKNPIEFYQFAFKNLYFPDSEPNQGHKVLAKWEQEGRIKHIITQNIDGLHQKAGSKNLIEFHGTMKAASCINCGRVYSTEEMIRRMSDMENFYVCEDCFTKNKRDRFIKPNVVLFGDRGEWFTNDGFNKITTMISEADCLLVLGTSLQVTPFSIFPSFRIDESPLIIINKGETPYDHQPNTYILPKSIGQTLQQIDEII